MSDNPNALELYDDNLTRYKAVAGQPNGGREMDKLSPVEMGVETRAADLRRMYGTETGRRWYRSGHDT